MTQKPEGINQEPDGKKTPDISDVPVRTRLGGLFSIFNTCPDELEFKTIPDYDPAEDENSTTE